MFAVCDFVGCALHVLLLLLVGRDDPQLRGHVSAVRGRWLALTPVPALLPALLTLLVVALVLVAMVAVETHRFAELRHAVRHGSHDA